jgi:hypothetical protein
METLEKYFEDSKADKIKILKQDYDRRMEMATDKLYANHIILDEKNKEFEIISANYKLELKWHIDKSMKLNKHLTFDNAVKDYFKGEPIKKIKIALKEYGDIEGWIFFLGELRQDSLRLIPEILDEFHSEYDYIIEWSKKMSQRNFIKLIYSLHYAGYIDNSEGQITFLVEEIARRLNFNLGDNWQSNVSKGNDYSNKGYDPTKIFDDLKNAYIDNSKD